MSSSRPIFDTQTVQYCLGLSAFFALYMIIGYFAQFICNFVGFVIPAYASMRAIESTTKEDDTKWLTYWVVFALFSVVDFFADGILRYFPFYWLAKIVFLVYCFFPARQNGSYVIYHRIIRPYFLKHQGAVDSAYQRAAAGVHAAGVDVASKLAGASKSE
ncbi:receptor expression-enhancing protein 5-like isoform X3 [Ornithodoros turicata]|uniref:receptor expression-enhancing protein 5-like isoform X3 n=1 Tax=Ornithodoros turicata TaxID=34597 RepID=UPI003138B47F